jgi:hypothetical protein
MLRIFSFVSFLLVAQLSSAHQYFFAFAEVDFDELNGTLEATIISSAHDVEQVLKENGILTKSLDYAKTNKKEYYAINDYLNDHFSFHSSDSLSFAALDSSLPQQIKFVMDGFEVLMNGDVQFYLSAKTPSNLDQFYLKFDMLMDKFPEQQNKLTLRFRDKKLTYNFLTTTKIQLIKFEL